MRKIVNRIRCWWIKTCITRVKYVEVDYTWNESASCWDLKIKFYPKFRSEDELIEICDYFSDLNYKGLIIRFYRVDSKEHCREIFLKDDWL